MTLWVKMHQKRNELNVVHQMKKHLVLPRSGYGYTSDSDPLIITDPLSPMDPMDRFSTSVSTEIDIFDHPIQLLISTVDFASLSEML